MIKEKLIKLIKKRGILMTSELSKIHINTLGGYTRQGVCPSLDKAEKILNALGYELVIVKRGEQWKNS